MPCQINVLLPRNWLSYSFISLHEYSNELIANFRDHFRVVNRSIFVLQHHIFVQNQSLLNIMFVWLQSALSHLSFSQLLPAILIQTFSVEHDKEKNFRVEFSISFAWHFPQIGCDSFVATEHNTPFLTHLGDVSGYFVKLRWCLTNLRIYTTILIFWLQSYSLLMTKPS